MQVNHNGVGNLVLSGPQTRSIARKIPKYLVSETVPQMSMLKHRKQTRFKDNLMSNIKPILTRSR